MMACRWTLRLLSPRSMAVRMQHAHCREGHTACMQADASERQLVLRPPAGNMRRRTSAPGRAPAGSPALMRR